MHSTPRSWPIPYLPGVLVGWSALACSVALGCSLILEAATHGPHLGGLALATMIMVAVTLLGIKGCKVPAFVRRQQIYVAVTLTWVIVTLLGALPYWLSGAILDPIQAWFESTSGFTTVGSTVLAGDHLDQLGYGLLFWRAATQWIGGIGIVILAVMALPVLGVGGLELIGAEAPGPTTDKFTPRARTTAWRVAGVYVVLTVLCTGFLMMRGLPVFDALTSAFTTIATGGFSTRSTSFADFAHDPILLLGLSVFMACGATDMGVFWRAWRGDWRSVWMHGELRAYLGWIALACTVIAGANWAAGAADPVNSIFTTVSFLTTTGFGSVPWVAWPAASLVMLLLVMFPGGMTGSTTGGLKILRGQIAWQMIRNEVAQLRRAHRIVAVRIGPGQARVEREVVRSVLAFLCAYALLWVVSVLASAMAGMDPWTAIAAVTCSMSTIGATLGDLAHGDWSTQNVAIHLIHILDMLAGRLEILPLAVSIGALGDFLRMR